MTKKLARVMVIGQSQLDFLHEYAELVIRNDYYHECKETNNNDFSCVFFFLFLHRNLSFLTFLSSEFHVWSNIFVHQVGILYFAMPTYINEIVTIYTFFNQVCNLHLDFQMPAFTMSTVFLCFAFTFSLNMVGSQIIPSRFCSWAFY